MRFEFATAARIVFGPGTLREAGPLAREHGRRALVVTGRDSRRAEPLVSILVKSGVDHILCPTSGEPDIAAVEQGVSLARNEQCELVIGFGGGSALDAAKAIAAMLANPGSLLDYLEVVGHGKPLPGPGAPFIAIPTTAGTGSEVTRNAVLASPEHHVKASLRSPFMLARAALVDPELTHGLPASITASTGLDALTQLIEPYVCARPNPMTDALCEEGMVRTARSLRLVCAEPRHAAGREDMAMASLFGGLALANAGLGAAHGFAGPIGGLFPAPHGAVCAALLSQVMAANLDALAARQPHSDALLRYQRIACLLTGNSAATPSDGVEWVRRLVADLRIPGLGAYGVSHEHISDLVEKAGRASSMKANPIPLTREELSGILQRSL